MFAELQIYFMYLALGCLILSVSIGLFKFKGLRASLQIFVVFLIFNLCIEIGAKILFHQKMNNLPLLHLYTFGEFILLSFFFKSLTKEIPIFQKWLPPIMIIVGLLIVGNSAFLQSIYGFNSYAKTLTQVIIIIYSVLYFYTLSDEVSLNNLEQKSLRLINSAIIVYYSGSLFIFMFSNYFLKKQIELHQGFWAFNALLNLVFQFLVLYGIWKVAFRQMKFSS